MSKPSEASDIGLKNSKKFHKDFIGLTFFTFDYENLFLTRRSYEKKKQILGPNYGAGFNWRINGQNSFDSF